MSTIKIWLAGFSWSAVVSLFVNCSINPCLKVAVGSALLAADGHQSLGKRIFLFSDFTLLVPLIHVSREQPSRAAPAQNCPLCLALNIGFWRPPIFFSFALFLSFVFLSPLLVCLYSFLSYVVVSFISFFVLDFWGFLCGLFFDERSNVFLFIVLLHFLFLCHIYIFCPEPKNLEQSKLLVLIKKRWFLFHYQ